MYTCGPTVYGHPHIGNYRTFIFEDVLVRALRRFGYQVERVMNVTDVGHLVGDGDEGEDKLEVGAKRDGITAWDVAKRYEESFLSDLIVLNLEKPEPLIRATVMIGEQIEMIRQLEEKGHTYITSDGVYFDTGKLPYYGELARLDIAGLQEGARVDAGEKRSKTDFALWKFSEEPGKRHMEWESPWGLGFPGWHIECSAIIRTSLGDSIDIHCGGADHIMVHHPNEMAQSETVTGQPLARFWCHGEFLLVDGGKMSKSLGNVWVISDLLERGYDPIALKLLCYSANYRSKLNFTWEGLTAAQKQLDRLREVYQSYRTAEDVEKAAHAIASFNAAIADDLNVPAALAVVYDSISSMENGPRRAFLESVDQVLALDLGKVSNLEIPTEVSELLEKRAAARAAKDFQESDRLRDEIAAKGFSVLDTPEGQKAVKSF
jgi:cysteinyl-tRNA synthetase